MEKKYQHYRTEGTAALKVTVPVSYTHLIQASELMCADLIQ